MKQPIAIAVLALHFALTPLLHADAPRSWTLNTDDTRLTLGVGPDGAPTVLDLSNPAAGWNWAGKGGSPFPLVERVDVGGARHATAWKFAGAAVDKAEGTKVTLTFTNAEPALELTSIWHARLGPGPVRHTVFIANKSGRAVTLYEQESADLRVVGPGKGVGVWSINDDGGTPEKDGGGVHHDVLADGKYQKTLKISEDQDYIPYVAIDADDGGKAGGVYVGWEWSVGRIALASREVKGGVRLRAGNRDDFKTDLAAGQTFEVPPAFVGAYAGDLDDAGNGLRKYLLRYNTPAAVRDDPAFPKIEWNAFNATAKAPGSWKCTELHYRPLVDLVAAMGFEEVMLDVGWWQGDTNHWALPPAGDPDGWPSGILAARDYAHGKGLRFGLYWNRNTPMTTEQGIRERESDAAALYDRFKPDIYRSDGTAGNVVESGGSGPTARAHYAEDVGYWQAKGYYEALDHLYKTVPNFSYENCSGGGRIKDYGIMRRAYKIQVTDEYTPLTNQRSFFDGLYAFPAAQISGVISRGPGGMKYWFRSASMGSARMEPDPMGWSRQQIDDTTAAVETYKAKLRPLVRSANVYHIFPRPDDRVWTGMEFFDPETKRGAVYVFRPDSPEGRGTIKFKGLNADATYWVWGEDGSVPAATHAGKELMAAGVTAALPDRHTSDIVFVEDAALGKPAELVAPEAFALGAGAGGSSAFGAWAALKWERSPHAHNYRVAVAQDAEFARVLASVLVSSPSATVGNLPPAADLYWKVEAISGGGTAANAGGAAKVVTPALVEVRSKDGITFASDLPWVKATAGSDTVHRDKNLHGQPVTIAGKTYPKALWTHAFNDNGTPAEFQFDIAGKKYGTFKASAGLDDLGDKGSVQFEVWVDGQKKAGSPVVRGRQTFDFAVDVSGAKQVTLHVFNGGDGYNSDHAAWAMARFVDAGASDPVGSEKR